MSYLALARKWRPRTFSQLVGQDHITKALINSLNQHKLHHAYLFSGTRGVGKTSIARLFAKALNCEQGISAEPCLQCSACEAIEQGRFIDLIEVDAASRTGVEDTRALLDNTQYAATNGRFKIYLIDEVHMLSTASFNALLKTLEEPPEHVKFLLATTDPQKIPVTVLSRCLQFNLKHLSADLINHHLQQIMHAEQIDFEPESLTLLARAARGSMRDALSLLDQCLASMDSQLTAMGIKAVLGYTQQDYALQLLQMLAIDNGPKLIAISRQIASESGHFHYVLEQMLHHLHQITLIQTLPEDLHRQQLNPDLTSLAQQITPEDCQLFYDIALRGNEEIDLAPEISVGFEMTLLRMMTFKPMKMTVETNQPTPLQSQNELSITTPPDKVQLLRNSSELKSSNSQLPAITVPEIPLSLPAQLTANEWITILAQLKLSGLAANALEHTQLINREENILNLGVAKGHQSLFTPTVTSRIEQALSDFYQESIKLKLEFQEQVESTPSQQKHKNQHEKLQQAETALDIDPVFQQLKADFSAELVKKSIMPVENDV